MITNIEIRNLKSILFGKVEVGNLNLYTGVNGSGKSSFLQSLLFLRQSYNNGGFFKTPYLFYLGDQDSLVNLGTFKDTLCQLSKKGDEKIEIKILTNQSEIFFSSEEYFPDNRDFRTIQGEFSNPNLQFETENLFNHNFQYLAAERIEPIEDYPRFQNNELLGKKGEYTAHYIEKYSATDIPIKNLSLKDSPASYSLIYQLNDWMGAISNSIEVLTKENLSTNRIELSYRYKQEDGTPTQNQKPQNVGFGITHTLPIIVAVLSAKKGDIILIENPETHLHPAGQTKLAFLFAIAAENGVQLFIETHSDHIVNGLRVAVKKRKISHSNLFINYFSKLPSNITKIERIRVDEDGGLEKWPDGFFDEWDNSLNDLL